MTCYSIGELAVLLGVAVITLRRWHKDGKLVPKYRTPGGHRRYALNEVRQHLNIEEPASSDKLTVCYARVSSHDQKEQLKTQAQRLEQHCTQQGWQHCRTLKDLGSGMNYKNPGLRKLLQWILTGQVKRLVLVTQDRLLRFGAELLFNVCRQLNVEVVVLDAQAAASREVQLASDLVEIITVFSSRLYGSRSLKNLKAIAAMVN